MGYNDNIFYPTYPRPYQMAYFQFGQPKYLSALQVTSPDLTYLKRNTPIVIIDDQEFSKSEALKNNGFSITELRDINAIDLVSAYPIVVCDIRGVGTSLNSTLQGAHLISEIRKAYPDKFLVSYSGAQFDITYNESLRDVDASISKDISTELWVQTLEKGIKKVSDPKERWVRLRNQLLERNVEIYTIFNLEQQFIKAIEKKDDSLLTTKNLTPEIAKIVSDFSKIALTQIIKNLLI